MGRRTEEGAWYGRALLAELPGILNWAVASAVAWQNQGLTPPDAVRAATASYRAEQDAVTRWIDERCSLERDAQTPFAPLFADYTAWAQESGEFKMSGKAFGDRLTQAGPEKGKGAHGVKTRKGVRLGQREGTAPASSEREPGADDDDATRMGLAAVSGFQRLTDERVTHCDPCSMSFSLARATSNHLEAGSPWVTWRLLDGRHG